jgi:hypothetical protein
MARKRYQKGQLSLEGGRWYGRWREDVLVGGVRKRVRVQQEIGTRAQYPTERLALRELDKRIEHVNAISYRPRPSATFAQFAEKWEREVLSQFGESTAVNYRTHIRKHLVPFFGRYAMKDVNPELVQHFVYQSRVSPKTTRNICVTLQSMWATAKAWGYIAHNVMEGVVLPRTKRRQRLFASQRHRKNLTARSTGSPVDSCSQSCRACPMPPHIPDSHIAALDRNGAPRPLAAVDVQRHAPAQSP